MSNEQETEKEKFKLFVFGLDRAGKTAIISTIKENKPITTTKPTLNLLVSKYFVENVEFAIWDAPGQIKLRSLWPQGYKNAGILFFVLDLSDPDRFQESKDEFDKVMEATKGVNLVFCYHKTDLGEENFKKAREFCKLGDIKRRKIVSFKTSIHEEESMRELRKVLQEIAMGIFF